MIFCLASFLFGLVIVMWSRWYPNELCRAFTPGIQNVFRGVEAQTFVTTGYHQALSCRDHNAVLVGSLLGFISHQEHFARQTDRHRFDHFPLFMCFYYGLVGYVVSCFPILFWKFPQFFMLFLTSGQLNLLSDAWCGIRHKKKKKITATYSPRSRSYSWDATKTHNDASIMAAISTCSAARMPLYSKNQDFQINHNLKRRHH